MTQRTMTLVDLALKVYREKSQALPVILSHELEAGFMVLLQLANGDPARIIEAQSYHKATQAELKAAAIYFIERYAFKEYSDPYQTLGLSPLATESEVKTHYRLMMRLFHPDRTSLSPKRARNYATLINQAMGRIENKSQEARPLQDTKTRGPIELPRDRINRYRPDSSFTKSLRTLVLNYSLFFLAAILSLSLYLIYQWQQHQPTLILKETPSPIAVDRQSLTPLGEMTSEAKSNDQVTLKKTEDTMPLEPRIETPMKAAEVVAFRDEPEDTGPLSLPKSLIKKRVTEKVRPPVDMKLKDLEPSSPESPASDKQMMEVKINPNGDDIKPINQKEINKPPVEKIFSLQDMRSLTYGFVSAYNDGQLEAIMQLMADDVKTETTFNKAELKNAYAQLFANTVKREMILRNLQFSVLPSSFKAKTHYQVKLFEVNRKDPKMVFGELEIEGALNQASPKIISLYNRTLP